MRPMKELKLAEKRAEKINLAEKRGKKLDRKKGFNETRHEHRQAYLKQTGNDRTIASLSRWHPDYGMTIAQHEAQKAKRAAGEVPFVNKVDLKIRRGALARGYGL